MGVASPRDGPDEEARDLKLVELLDQYGALIRRTILRVSPADRGLSSDDIEQEARISLWKALKAERKIEFPASYIHKVAVSATLRALRRFRARREEPLPDDNTPGAGPAMPDLRAPSGSSPYELAEREELRRTIEAALERLQDNRRTAVKLHLQGLTTREIGDLVGWTEPKARNLVHRGLGDLRTALRALGIEYGE